MAARTFLVHQAIAQRPVTSPELAQTLGITVKQAHQAASLLANADLAKRQNVVTGKGYLWVATS